MPKDIKIDIKLEIDGKEIDIKAESDIKDMSDKIASTKKTTDMRSIDFVSWGMFAVLVICIVVGTFDLIANGFDGKKWMACAAGAFMAVIFDGSYHIGRPKPGEKRIDWMDKFR